MNTFRTTALMAVMLVLFALIGQALGGTGGMLIAFLIAVGMNGVSYWYSSSIVLRMYGAEEVTRAEAPELHDLVDRLRQRDQPNAFATGRNPDNAVVAVTEGIMNTLDRDELAGVIAHELAHIKNRDMLTSTVAATLAGAITMLSRFALFFGGRDNNFLVSLLMMILAPLAAMLIQSAISRSREYAADREGAEIAKNPLGLASALRSMEQAAKHRSMPANQTTSHMFIVNPFSGGLSGIKRLFSTHPPTEERIARLEEMAGRA
ncbi:MAG: protease HtpX [Bacteroidetes bacterium QS_3_64_15]|nr:MAG: protease HtpX [Bacteroidetes bacterium QS_3_64_15]